jgi:uncharacterized protein (TIGR00299 family) protein
VSEGASARRIGWLDLGCGASGDMLLGALVDAGVPIEVLGEAVAALGVGVRLTARPVRRAGLAATKVDVDVGADVEADAGSEAPRPRRTPAGVADVLDAAALEPAVRDRAHAVFDSLAAAEARVHGTPLEAVHFHEVGALDALADVVGVCAGLVALDLDTLVASPLALGAGSARTEHGVIPVPVPAVLELVARAGAPVHGGPVGVELCTPTGAALVTSWTDRYGPMPPMRVRAVGSGAGGRDLTERPNVVRLVVGEPLVDGRGGVSGLGATDSATASTSSEEVVVEANIDDLDPRVWPDVLSVLLAAGASDAWLTPILMKKGRPAHTLSVLAPGSAVPRLRDLVVRHTSTLGTRQYEVVKEALARTFTPVDVEGHTVRVKIGMLDDGTVVTSQPEWEDVVAAARALARPARDVLDAATQAGRAVTGTAERAAVVSVPNGTGVVRGDAQDMSS